MRSIRQLEPGYQYKNRYIIDNIFQIGDQAITYFGRDQLQDHKKILLKHILVPAEININKVMSGYKNIRSLDHPNIIKRYECYVEEFAKNKFQLYIILQYIDGEILTKHLGHLSPSQIFKIYNQIKSALQYIHSEDIIHRDVTLGNILLNKNKDAILIDFGIATDINDMPVIISTDIDINNYKPIQFIQKRIITKEIDKWQFGIVLIQLVAGQSIVQIASINGYLNPALNKNFPQDVFSKYKVTQQFRSLISPLLRKQYKQRKFYQAIINIEPKYKTVSKLMRATDNQLQSTFNQNHIQNLLQLDCSNCLLTNESGKTIRLLKKLEKLEMAGNNITDQFTYYIDPLLPRLIALKMAFTNIRDESLQLITKKSTMMKQLDISYTLVTAHGIMILSQLNKLSSLAIWSGQLYYPQRYQELINIGGVQLKYESNKIKISEECIKQLCNLKLTQLCMNAEGIEMDELICRMSTQSASVEIRGRINSKTVEYICGMKKIQRIYLESINEIEIKQFKSTCIKCCDLVKCKVNANNLIKSLEKCKQLKSLNLSYDNIGNQGVIQIANNLKNLTSLNLRSNNISKQGVIEISKNLKNLVILNLNGNNIGKQQAIKISKNLNNLTSLDLGYNNIGNQGAIEIAKNLKNLICLNLGKNNIDKQGVIHIAKYLKNLVSLNLDNNNIGKQGAIQIAKNIKSLISLNLYNNQIGNQGAVEIGKNLKNLTSLYLMKNQIGKLGAIEIAKNLKSLTYLALNYNEIDNQSKKLIKQYLPTNTRLFI